MNHKPIIFFSTLPQGFSPQISKTRCYTPIVLSTRTFVSSTAKDSNGIDKGGQPESYRGSLDQTHKSTQTIKIDSSSNNNKGIHVPTTTVIVPQPPTPSKVPYVVVVVITVALGVLGAVILCKDDPNNALCDRFFGKKK
jgi:hypothetical protein